jgi:hypothetical protein
MSFKITRKSFAATKVEVADNVFLVLLYYLFDYCVLTIIVFAMFMVTIVLIVLFVFILIIFVIRFLTLVFIFPEIKLCFRISFAVRDKQIYISS